MEIREMTERFKGAPVQRIYEIATEIGVHGNTVYAIARGHRKKLFNTTRSKIEAYFEKIDNANG